MTPRLTSRHESACHILPCAPQRREAAQRTAEHTERTRAAAAAAAARVMAARAEAARRRAFRDRAEARRLEAGAEPQLVKLALMCMSGLDTCIISASVQMQAGHHAAC